MNFYLEALDRQEKRADENPSIGIILCTENDQAIVEYSISRNTSPLLISEFSTKLIDKKILENKVIELRKMLDDCEN